MHYGWLRSDVLKTEEEVRMVSSLCSLSVISAELALGKLAPDAECFLVKDVRIIL